MERGKTRRKGIFTVPTYVLNMKERPDRWKRYTDQPAVHTLKNLKRSLAVNGKKLRYKTDKRISVRTRLNIFRNYRRSHYEIATLGAVGCSLSHIDAWKKFLKTSANVGLFMEDDAIVTETVLENINKLMGTLPAGWGMWLLGWYKPNLIYETAEKPWNRVYGFTASHSYLLTREAARKFLEDALPIETHIDHYMTSAAVLKDILIVQHPDIHVEFFRKERGPRTVDSNTSQHKRSGCPTCSEPDDYSQIYRSHTRKTTRGMKVRGLIDGEQSKHILKLAKR